MKNKWMSRMLMVVTPMMIVTVVLALGCFCRGTVWT